MREKAIAIFLGGFGAGVLFRSFFTVGFSFTLFLLLIAGALFFVGRSGRRVSGTEFVLVAFLLCGIAGGILRFGISEWGAQDKTLSKRVEEKSILRGVIVLEPDERESSVRLTLHATVLVSGDTQVPVDEKVLLVTSLYPQWDYGDFVEVSGTLSKPKNFADPDGRVFDYEGYLAKEGIHFEMFRPTIARLDSGRGNRVVGALLSFKHAFIERVGRAMPEPHASLLAGLVVGAKRALGQDLLEDFRRAGVVHIVVLSGYNITIVAEAVMKFFSFLPRYAGQSFGALSIILFAVMTGGSATVVRASIMALLVIFAKTIGRRYDITRALIFAGFLMILQNPKILVFDSSFQLSFASTLALIYVAPLLEKYFLFVTEKYGFRSIVVSTIATQIFVLPMLLYKMGDLSLVALPVNLLVLPVIPTTMLFGFLAGAAEFVSHVLAFPFAAVAYVLLGYELALVEFFSHLRFASLSIPVFPLWCAVAWYALYAVLLVRFHEKKEKPAVPRGIAGEISDII